jgi:predicted histone-like DNA-binding protein
MPFRYKKKKIVLKFDKENPVEKYVASNVLVGSIPYSKLCDEVNQRTGIHRAMVDIVLAGAQDTMISFLEEGFSVRFGEFGSFRPSINAESQDTVKAVKADTVVRRKIIFTPGTTFRAMLYRNGMEMFSDTANATDEATEDAEITPPDDDGGVTPDPNL